MPLFYLIHYNEKCAHLIAERIFVLSFWMVHFFLRFPASPSKLWGLSAFVLAREESLIPCVKNVIIFKLKLYFEH